MDPNLVVTISIFAIFHNGLQFSWVCYLISPEMKSRNFDAAVTIRIIRGPELQKGHGIITKKAVGCIYRFFSKMFGYPKKGI